MFKNENVYKLQKQLTKDGLDAYLILTTDPHFSEYIAPRFLAERLYFAPFTGSAGQLLVTKDDAYLFTDGRYWIQAGKQLDGTCVKLVKEGDIGVLPLEKFIKHLGINELAVDLTMVSVTMGNTFDELGIKLVDKSYRELVEDLPELSKDKIFALPSNLHTLTTSEKIDEILKEVEDYNCEAHFISTLDDIAWILNSRGKDIECTPVFYSYLYLSRKYGNHLFIDLDKIDFEIEGVQVHPYSETFAFLKKHNDVKTLIDKNRTSLKVVSILNKIKFKANPSVTLKATKGPVEIENTKRIQAIDGVCLLKFQKYLEEHLKDNLTEFEYSQYLDNLRLSNKKDCLDLSFGTIAACGENAALMHYSATKDKTSVVSSNDIELLVDSGGHYFGGTTDTTRTFLLGKPSAEYVHDYTLTLKAVINLSRTIFLKNSSGQTIDIRAREIMWKEGLDYKCGTGHGVGYMLNVHEAPNGFRYYQVPERDDQGKIVPGMITTIEPGVYKEGKYGIRIENNLLCISAFSNDMGEFFKFETITYVPITTESLDLNLLSDEEISWLNDYHKSVYEHLYPLIKEDIELVNFLKLKTKEIHR